MKEKQIVIVGAGVAGVNAATKLSRQRLSRGTDNYD
jgi:NADH dehydrogenase FAD-containing subunit